MVQRVNLDAMIQREDFARETAGQPTPRIITELKLSDLLPNSGIRRQLRKPEFQRETNHWTPEQVVRLVKSFIDGDVIPSIILWRSTNFVFVIDGAHRLSALCAWLEGDYGDRATSKAFYNDEISEIQKRVAARVRKEIEKEHCNYSILDGMVGKPGDSLAALRAGAMNTRPIVVQTVEGNAKVAEESFFAINSQGTPLDDTEKYLIRNRNKAVSIGARAIARSGTGHVYWSSFGKNEQDKIVSLSKELHTFLFEPEVSTPLKTLDLPLAGSKSPVEALSVLIDFLTVVSPKPDFVKLADSSIMPDDKSGDNTIQALERGLQVVRRITTNRPESLGLHAAVYFSNDKGKHNKFLFLGCSALIAEKLRNNDGDWFKKFTRARANLERFLIDNKSAIGNILHNLAKKARIPKMTQMIRFLVDEFTSGRKPEANEVFLHIGLSGKIYDLGAEKKSKDFDDNTKSQIFYRDAIKNAQKCPVCSGYLDVAKSVSYDHITPVREGGLGEVKNGQLVHPYCNSSMKG